MKLANRMWIASALAAFALGMVAEACATAQAGPSDDAATSSGTNCATLTTCCATLSSAEAMECTPTLSADDDTGCGTYLASIQAHGLCTNLDAATSSSTTTSISTSSTAVGSTPAASSTSSVAGVDSGVDSGTSSSTGSDAGSGMSSGTGTGSSSGSSSNSGTGTGGGGTIPTTCAKANNAIGCCGPNGKLYYCLSSSASAPTVKTCSSGDVCGWDTAKGYYYCVATPGTAPVGDPSACQ